MTRTHHILTNAEERAARDRTRHALAPTVVVAVLLAAALLATASPVVVGLATLGLGSTAVAFARRR